MFLAKNIRYLRKRSGLSQLQVAEKFGYDNYTTIQKWESEKSDPPVKVVKGLSELFNVNIDDLVKVDLEAIALSPSKSSPAASPDPAGQPALTEREAEHLRRYRYLDEEGRKWVDATLDREYDRCAAEKGNASSA